MSARVSCVIVLCLLILYLDHSCRSSLSSAVWWASLSEIMLHFDHHVAASGINPSLNLERQICGVFPCSQKNCTNNSCYSLYGLVPAFYNRNHVQNQGTTRWKLTRNDDSSHSALNASGGISNRWGNTEKSSRLTNVQLVEFTMWLGHNGVSALENNEKKGLCVIKGKGWSDGGRRIFLEPVPV